MRAATKLPAPSSPRRIAMVTVGTDGFVDYVQVSDGQKYMLGPVSVLRVITGAARSASSARIALKEFLESGKTMLPLDLDQMWEMLPFRRARYSSEQEQHAGVAEDILAKVAETNTTVDYLARQGKRFDAVRVKQDLLKIASRVTEIVQEVDSARMGRDLAELSIQASKIHGLFPTQAR